MSKHFQSIQYSNVFHTFPNYSWQGGSRNLGPVIKCELLIARQAGEVMQFLHCQGFMIFFRPLTLRKMKQQRRALSHPHPDVMWHDAATGHLLSLVFSRLNKFGRSHLAESVGELCLLWLWEGYPLASSSDVDVFPGAQGGLTLLAAYLVFLFLVSSQPRSPSACMSCQRILFV